MSGGLRYIVGLGASGPMAERHLEDALVALQRHPLWDVVLTSAFFANPATGGVTHARFVNGAALVETALAPASLLRALHAIEAQAGRVRGTRWAARPLDLDLLLALDATAPIHHPQLPHPRLKERPFALLPALEVLERIGHPIPVTLRRAAAQARPGAHLLPTHLEERSEFTERDPLIPVPSPLGRRDD